MTPSATSASDAPTTFTTASVLSGASAGGMHASTIDTAVVTNPSAANAIATEGPPGTRITSGPADSRCSLIKAANMNRNGMKYPMIPMLTSASYARETVVPLPALPIQMNSAAIAACTSSATYGVRQRGWSAPKAGGRNRSMPATNGSRAVAANQPPTPPRALSVTRMASTGTSHDAPILPAMVCIACMIPCSPEICSFGSASSMARVPAIYRMVMTAPAARIARGTVRRASTISSPIVDPLSTPPNANAIVDQKITSLSVVLGASAPSVIGVADPNRIQDTAPKTMRKVPTIQPAVAPALFSHLPTFNPTTFITTASVRPASATAMKYGLRSARNCQRAPPTNSTLAAAKYSRPGKYGRFDPQYVHPVMNAANGPNARLLQT